MCYNLKIYLIVLSLVIFLAILAFIIQDITSNYFKLETLTWGIILGMAWVNLVGISREYNCGITFCQKKLLKAGIVLLGFKMSVTGIKTLGVKSIFIVILYVVIAISLAMIFQKILKVNKKTSLLIGLGSSICGASAVVALSDSIEAKKEDTAIAVSVVSLLGAIGVIVYTFIFKLYPISQIHYGLWSGLTLHGVAHAIAAAGAGGTVAKEMGTMIKLIRVLMLVPVSLILSKVFDTNGKSAKLPAYVLGFCITTTIGLSGFFPSTLVEYLLKVSDLLILLAMTGLGLSVNFKNIKSAIKGAITHGAIIFVILSCIGFMLTMLL
jgi:uncharacterized integral membrane protein (TIGR00698 family)